jgi:hypothetical protein
MSTFAVELLWLTAAAFCQDVHRLLQHSMQVKGAAYAFRKVVFLLSFASALTAEELHALAAPIRSYGGAFVKANEEPAVKSKANEARVLIQEIN